MKVTITKEVAEAIVDVRKFFRDSEIIAEIENNRGSTAYASKMSVLINFTRQLKGNIDVLMQALVNGYEVEKTPKEKLRDHYFQCSTKSSGFADEYDRGYNYGYMNGIEETLKILGITIERVTDQ